MRAVHPGSVKEGGYSNLLGNLEPFGQSASAWHNFSSQLMADKYSVIFLTRPGVRACKSAILRSFKQFLYFLHSKIWAHFHFGTFDT